MNKGFKKISPLKAFAMLVFLVSLFDASSGIADLLPKKDKPHVVFLISEDPDNYEATRTIPVFAEKLRKEQGFEVTVLLGEGPRSAFSFPGLSVLSEADLLVVFCRRVALTDEQLGTIRKYLKNGKPVVGIRTANHAFTVREKVENGYRAWPEFVADILGCENRGYGPVEPGTEVSISASARKHPILKNIEPAAWHSKGNVYRVSPLLDTGATVLLTGRVDNKTEPIAWTRLTKDKSRVFYTSLGYPADFDDQQFNQLLVNSMYWALDIKRRK